MVTGEVVARSPGPKFRTQASPLGDLGGTGFTHGLVWKKADAFRCEACGTVVVPGSPG
jgi:hypothetical protein